MRVVERKEDGSVGRLVIEEHWHAHVYIFVYVFPLLIEIFSKTLRIVCVIKINLKKNERIIAFLHDLILVLKYIYIYNLIFQKFENSPTLCSNGPRSWSSQ